MLTLISKNDSRLRQPSQPVNKEEFGSQQLKNWLDDFYKILNAADDGIALAAPQAGIFKRIFIVSEKINNDRKTKLKNLIFINPLIIRSSKKKIWLEEGCLSVRDIYGSIQRCEKVTVEAHNTRGEKFVYHGSGLLAQIFQHEIDHLNGVLFIDKAVNLHEIKPAKP